MPPTPRRVPRGGLDREYARWIGLWVALSRRALLLEWLLLRERQAGGEAEADKDEGDDASTTGGICEGLAEGGGDLLAEAWNRRVQWVAGNERKCLAGGCLHRFDDAIDGGRWRGGKLWKLLEGAARLLANQREECGANDGDAER